VRPGGGGWGDDADARRAVAGPPRRARGKGGQHRGHRAGVAGAEIEEPAAARVAADLPGRLAQRRGHELGIGGAARRRRALGDGIVSEEEIGELPEGPGTELRERPRHRGSRLGLPVPGAVEEILEVLAVAGEGGRAHRQSRGGAAGPARLGVAPHLLGGAAREHPRADGVGLGEEDLVLGVGDAGHDVGVPGRPGDGRDHSPHRRAEGLGAHPAPQRRRSFHLDQRQREGPAVAARLVELLAGVVDEVGQVVGAAVPVAEAGALQRLDAAGVAHRHRGEAAQRLRLGSFRLAEASPGPVGEEREPHRLPLGGERRLEGVGGRASGRREGLTCLEAGGEVAGARVEPFRQHGAVDEAARPAQRQVTALVGDPQRRALGVGGVRQGAQGLLDEPLRVEHRHQLERRGQGPAAEPVVASSPGHRAP
jgi:hypothetical protein